ncbi:ATP-binding cassette domain-containing protein [candidate division GN15 bacterium]|nr:ATP-binding cassette domain-containing protein [candidate division GN15 bacterium]
MTEKQRKTPFKERFRQILGYFRQYKRYLILGALAIICTNSLVMTIPYITKIVFDLLEKGAAPSEIRDWVLLGIGAAVLAGVFRFSMRRTIIWMSRWIEYNLRGDLFAHLLKLSPSFYQNSRTGDLMARSTNDLEAVRMMIGPGIMYIGNTLVSMAVAVTLMITLSPKLTLYAIGPMVIFPIAVNRLGNAIHQRFQRIQEHFSELTATAQENLSGIRVVRAYRQEDHEIEHFDKMSQKYVELNMDYARIQAFFIPFLFFLAATLNVVVLYFGGKQVIDGVIPLGTMVAFLAYLNMLFWPMFALGWVVSLYQRGTASLDRINRVLDTKPDVENGGQSTYRQKMQGRVEFRNLSFSYGDAPVLTDISFVIEPGETVGIVGPTGSGKTTLVSLLARLYPVEPGQIFIDERDINDWDIPSLRRQIGFAPQEPFLFSDTVGANIAYGRNDAAKDIVLQAANTADLAKDVDHFPDQFDTMVGERGITLSGGQKQRAAIARAILIEPGLIIFDDATSSVDTETEREINARIKSVLSKRTAIVISHRVASVKDADQIIYLQAGKIAERGTHEELMSRDGAYASLYRSQLLEEELERL